MSLYLRKSRTHADNKKNPYIFYPPAPPPPCTKELYRRERETEGKWEGVQVVISAHDGWGGGVRGGRFPSMLGVLLSAIQEEIELITGKSWGTRGRE
jgi:hypothetical protein